jgi:hypothetical protein
MAQPPGQRAQRVHRIRPVHVNNNESQQQRPQRTTMHLLDDIPPVCVLSLVRPSFKCSLCFDLDLLTERRNQFDVYIRFEECCTNLFEHGVKNLWWHGLSIYSSIVTNMFTFSSTTGAALSWERAALSFRPRSARTMTAASEMRLGAPGRVSDRLSCRSGISLDATLSHHHDAQRQRGG